MILPGDDRDPGGLLDRFDGLLLVGGGDVEPTAYGQDPNEAVYGVEPDRDAFEFSLLRQAEARGMPALCICRGMQVLNVAFGGTLNQHLPDDDRYMPHGTPSGADALYHDVKLKGETRIAIAAGAETLSCSSHHHQGLEGLGEGLAATGWSEDGLVEAIERTTGWVVGVQWHPEDSAASDPAQQGLFDGFVRRAFGG